jgi:quinol monooxygenase YgiN
MDVDPENVEQLRALIAAGRRVAADEPGTLTYDWFYSEEQGSVLVVETYADSAAHLTHMQAEGHGELMGSIMALISSIEFDVLGESTPEHAEALSAIPGAQFDSEIASSWRTARRASRAPALLLPHLHPVSDRRGEAHQRRCHSVRRTRWYAASCA